MNTIMVLVWGSLGVLGWVKYLIAEDRVYRLERILRDHKRKAGG
jgi:hypothetical protein